MILRGKVKNGLHHLSYWMEKFENHFTEKTGIKLFPGSLNIELEEDYVLPTTVIRLEKEEIGGTTSINFQPCKIFDRKAFILRTDENATGNGNLPLNIIEIITDIKLRDKYNLQNDDIVEIEFED